MSDGTILIRLYATLALLLSACSHAATVSVAEFGAIPNDGIDDRAAFQAAIDSQASLGGGEVFIDSGAYLLSQDGTEPWCLDISGADNVIIVGESRGSVVLMQAAGIAEWVRLFSSQDGPVNNFTLRSLTLDGNKANQSIHEHRHGALFSQATNIRVEDVEARNFTGDGLYFHIDTSDVLVTRVILRDNDRSGLAIGANVSRLSLTGSTLYGNANQQFDSEGNLPNFVIDDISIIGNTLISGDDFALTAGGTKDRYGERWRIIGNTIRSDGPAVRIIYAESLLFANNAVKSGSGAHSGVEVYSGNGRVIVDGNNIQSPNQGTNGAISVIATAETRVTEHVSISSNIVDVRGGINQTGIRVQGARNTTISANQVLTDAVSPTYSGGIVVRATLDMDAVVIAGNIVAGTQDSAILIAADVGAKLLHRINILGNTFVDTFRGLWFVGANLQEACLDNNQTLRVLHPVSGSPPMCVE